MRNPSLALELTQITEKEELPIEVSVMNVDSDESIQKAISAIQEEHGPIDSSSTTPGLSVRKSSALRLLCARLWRLSSGSDAQKCSRSIASKSIDTTNVSMINFHSFVAEFVFPD